MSAALLVAPFVLLVLALALGPVVAPAAWRRTRTQALVVGCLSVPLAIVLVALGEKERSALLESAREYVGFVAYVGSLYVVASTVRVTGSFRGGKLVNAVFLAAGATLASVVGTTGASLLLLRPLLRANKGRPGAALAVVFFIFVVSNGGGLLSPLGDPPLLLGFLRGAPFVWPFQALFAVWGTFVALAIVAYVLVASFEKGRDEAPGEIASLERLGVEGWSSIAILALIVASSVALSSVGAPVLASSLVILALAASSIVLAPAERRRDVESGPIVEVALAFAGIFVTVVPVLELVREHGRELPLGTPARDFLVAGALSSVLDNAPTYLVLVEAAKEANRALPSPLAGVGTTGVSENVLAAISAGCVLMGANTYIGNGPNLLVRAIAEKEGVVMPGFFRYVAWSALVLGPIYAAIVLIFFR